MTSEELAETERVAMNAEKLMVRRGEEYIDVFKRSDALRMVTEIRALWPIRDGVVKVLEACKRLPSGSQESRKALTDAMVDAFVALDAYEQRNRKDDGT